MTAAHPSLDAHHSPDTGHTLQTSPSPQVHSSSSRIYTPSPQAAHSPDPSLKNTYVLVSTPDGAVDTQSGAVEFWACARMDVDATARNRAMERNMVSGFVRLERTEIYIYIYIYVLNASPSPSPRDNPPGGRPLLQGVDSVRHTLRCLVEPCQFRLGVLECLLLPAHRTEPHVPAPVER